MFETMASLVCDTSLLKSTDYRLKGKTHSQKMCNRCDLGAIENIFHLIMQCPFYVDERVMMYRQLEELGTDAVKAVLDDPPNIFHILMGKHPDHLSFESMVEIWLISGHYISQMYSRAIVGRKE